MSAMYASILSLPPHLQSKLATIFPVMIFDTEDGKLLENRVIFSRLLKELDILKNEGVTVTLENGDKKTIYFELVGILGDNLGVHNVTGFVGSFSANHFCRYCLMHKNDINNVHDESSCTLRDKSNYQAQIVIGNVTETGLTGECVFNELDGFHILDNPTVDVMHNQLEGNFQYDLALILHYFITIMKFFTLAQLNERLRGFYYGPNDKKNKPPQIDETQLKNKKLKMSSAETLCLIRHIGIIIGDLIPEGNLCWTLVIMLKGICDIVTANSFQFLYAIGLSWI